jgi:hypothetical protein
VGACQCRHVALLSSQLVVEASRPLRERGAMSVGKEGRAC